jgi:AcrR family transcriptional regulator
MAEERKSYHHGNLRAALLRAGEEVLAETGVEAFSLRRVAKLVGVSHSAPAHHFGDASGLLSALAAEGFRRFVLAMRTRQAEAGGTPLDLLVASGLGYIDFAQASPALFRLMFASERPDNETPELAEAGEAAFRHLVEDVARLRGRSPFSDPAAMADVMAAWSMAHGLAELLISGRLKPLQGMACAEREAALRSLLARALG